MASINVKFYLKDPDGDQPSLILLKSYFNHQRLVYSTGQYIHPIYWDETTQRPITTKYEQLIKEVKVDPTKEKEINLTKEENEILYLVFQEDAGGQFIRLVIPTDEFSQRWIKYLVAIEIE